MTTWAEANQNTRNGQMAATSKQVSYIMTLAGQLDDLGGDGHGIIPPADELTKVRASALIDELKGLITEMRRGRATQIRNTNNGQTLTEGGIYMVDGEYVLTVRSERGNLYAKVFNPDARRWEYRAGVLRGVLPEHALTAEQAAEFGHAHGRCVFCNQGLSTDDSVSVGYGPVCAARHNLPWGA